MLVRPFHDEYRATSSFLDVPEDELRSADAEAPPMRWILLYDGAVVGVANGHRRPDGRVFVRFGRTPGQLIGRLAETVVRRLGSVHAIARSASDRSQLEAAGFVVEFVDDEFEMSFDKALRKLGRRRTPSGFDLLPPHDLDELRLAALDTELRQDVPGTDGWETTIEMWRAEIES
ncbi:MAG: hypothetical protein HKN91_02530, partial [Acidimicrobiia bacterium]|nr:hypothetical protein [Acidimicrobiia bacterium]